MFKIGEFSKLTQVTVRMLRYYDETGLLKPAAKDSWTGYRMYLAEQIPILNKIIYLRDSGFSVSEISAALHSSSDTFILQQLDKKYLEIEENIQCEKNKLKKITLAKNEIQHNGSEMHCNISIKSVPSYHVLSLRKVIPDYYSEGKLWEELSSFAQKNKVKISGDTFSIYHDTEYKEKNVDVELCACVTESSKSRPPFIFRHTEAVPTMACTMVYGDFSNIADFYLTFAKWLQNNSQYQMHGASRQIVHRGPWNETDTQKYLTEIQIPLMLDSHTV